jgi:threonyl-tRNA synthetase
MYPPLEVGQTLEELKKKEKVKESEQYLLKPMNCPFHVQIYKNRPRSYRELPFRWAECGTVYRFEKKGELSGLTRVRGFTQDDAHIFTAKDQVEEELKRVIDFILFIYRSFGFKQSDVKVYLSLRDPKNKKKYVGSDAGWKFSESVLKKVAIEKQLDFTAELGEAAFYGPKLDFKIKDALGREWQCSTLQFDFNLPERFKLSFINQKGKEEQPYILHRALFGSYERFIGLLIEHYAGTFPLWLAPTQIAILPIGESHASYAKEVAEKLRMAEFRIEINDANETLGKRIRETEMKKIPYIIVVGNEEMNTKTISIRKKGIKESKIMNADQFIEELKEELKK